MVGADLQSTSTIQPSRITVAIAMLGAGAVALVWRFLTFTGFNNDHYIYLAGAQQMVLGEWPVRDFVDPGWPLMYSVSALARVLFGRQLWVEFAVVSCAFAIGAAVTVAAAMRLSGSIVIALSVALLEVLMNPRSFGYPKILLSAIAGWALIAATERLTRSRVILLAALTVLAFLFRHDHGLYIGAGSLAAILFGCWKEGGRVIVSRVGVFFATLVVLLLPWAIFVQYYLGLVEYFRPALEFSRAEAEATVIRAMPPFDRTTSLFAQGNSEVALFYLFYALPVTCLILVGIRAASGRGRWIGESAGVAALAIMTIVMNLVFLRTPLAARLPDAAAPAALLGSWLIGLAWQPPTAAARRAAVTLSVLVLLAATTAVVVVAGVPGELNRAGILNRQGAIQERIDDLTVRLQKTMPEGSQIPSRNSEALMPFYGYVQRCSSPSDRLVMTGLSPDVFVLANRGFAGGQMAFRPAFYTTPVDQRRALTRMRSQSVPFVIVALEEEGGFRGDLPLVAAYVDEHYEPMTEIAVPDTRGLRVYVERGRTAVGRDRATGWPCFRR